MHNSVSTDKLVAACGTVYVSVVNANKLENTKTAIKYGTEGCLSVESQLGVEKADEALETLNADIQQTSNIMSTRTS